jgi:hypothetical protein
VEIRPTVREHLRVQQGLVRRGQLLEAGISQDVVRWRLGREWRLVLPGVIATFTGQLTRRQRLLAGRSAAPRVSRGRHGRGERA